MVMVSPTMTTDNIIVGAGGRGFAYDSIYESVLEELKIEKLESIEATLNVEPDDFFSDEVLYTADVVFEVK